jgi:uncharacterized protein YndB with AHSA1/START domain
MKNKLTISPSGDRALVMTRSFDAPRTMVFDALTKPELIKRWLGVFGKWTMPECEVDLRVGGKYRYVWKGPAGERMAMGGVFKEIVRPERIVTTELFDDPWYPGGAVGTAVLTEKGGKTTLTTTVEYVSREARDGVLKSPMESGVATSYDNLEQILTQTLRPAQETR